MQKSIEIKTPRVPNFILTDYKPIPIENFTEEELREIGKDWTEELVRHAKHRKEHPEPVVKKSKLEAKPIN